MSETTPITTLFNQPEPQQLPLSEVNPPQIPPQQPPIMTQIVSQPPVIQRIDPTGYFMESQETGVSDTTNYTLYILGQEIDQDSFIVLALCIAIWVFIWYGTGLNKSLQYDWIFMGIFVSFILYMLINIFISGISSGDSIYELNQLLSADQAISIFFGAMILFTLFSPHLPQNETCQKIVFRLNLAVLMVLALGSLWLNIVTNAELFRMIRKFKRGVYNIAVIMFFVICLILYKGTQCTIQTI